MAGDPDNYQPVSGWSAYEKLVLAQLAALDKDVKALDEQLMLLRIDVAQLKVKAGLWGALAGLIPSSIGAIMVLSGVVG